LSGGIQKKQLKTLRATSVNETLLWASHKKNMQGIRNIKEQKLRDKVEKKNVRTIQRIILKAVLMKYVARSVGKPKKSEVGRDTPLRKLKDFHCWPQIQRRS